MTGPEHYREAEQLLTDAFSSKLTTYEGENPEADRLIAAAQVHATLALAAATEAAGVPRGKVLADQCNVAESAYGRQCIKADRHDTGHDFGDGDA